MTQWTSVLKLCQPANYAVSNNQIFNADIGKFCNTYRSRSHMGDDDPEIFAWRKEHRVFIGPDVWIGHNAIHLSGLSVGTGSVVGAGAVVTRSVPPI